MNRKDFQDLAEVRLDEAATLLAAGKWDGVYYLAGYAVEFALKACIAKLANQYDFPDRDFANRCYTHNIEKLVELAGLKARRRREERFDPLFLLVHRKGLERVEPLRAKIRSRRSTAPRSDHGPRTRSATMDQITLVDEGRDFVARLPGIGLDVAVAAWVKSAEDDGWHLFIVTPAYDQLGPIGAYRLLHPVFRELPELGFFLSEVRLVSPKDPAGADLVRLKSQWPANGPRMLHPGRLGPLSVDEVHLL